MKAVRYLAAEAILEHEGKSMKLVSVKKNETSFEQEAFYVREDSMFDNPFTPPNEDYYFTMALIVFVCVVVGIMV